jgi:hypothetical protein
MMSRSRFVAPGGGSGFGHGRERSAGSGVDGKGFFRGGRKRPQTIEKVSDADKVPLEIAILFDISSSTGAMFQFQQETAAKFLQDVMRPDDRATIFTIGANAALVQARADASTSAVSIKKYSADQAVTAFYDSVRIAADYLNKNAPAATRKSSS